MTGRLARPHAPGPNLVQRLERVRAYLEANLGRDLDMRAIAREAPLSPFYLTRLFKAQYGIPRTVI